jgi:hypothetical protein
MAGKNEREIIKKIQRFPPIKNSGKLTLLSSEGYLARSEATAPILPSLESIL